jgi:hypothetical protein
MKYLQKQIDFLEFSLDKKEGGETYQSFLKKEIEKRKRELKKYTSDVWTDTDTDTEIIYYDDKKIISKNIFGIISEMKANEINENDFGLYRTCQDTCNYCFSVQQQRCHTVATIMENLNMERVTEKQYEKFINDIGIALHESYAAFSRLQQMNMIISLSIELINNDRLKKYLIHREKSDRKIVVTLSADIFDSVQMLL